MPFSGKNAAFCHISTASNYFPADFFYKSRAAPLSAIFPGRRAATAAPTRSATHRNIIIYAHIHTCARTRAYTYLTLIYLCIPKAYPPLMPCIIIARAKARVKSLRTAQKNERFRTPSKTLVCPTNSKNRFGRIFSQFHSGGFSGAKNKISYFARISATIFPVSANFSSISETSFSCVRQRTRLCPSYFVAK